jgi:hypothetical protein
MRKKSFLLTTTLAAALAVSACGRPANQWDESYNVYSDRNTAVCTDKNKRRVPDSYCQQNRGGGAGNAFMWYYLGKSAAVPYHGDPVRGGSFARTPGATYFHAPASSSVTRAAAVSRGGFGKSAFGSVGG